MENKTILEFALTTYCQAKCRSCARTNDVTGEKEEWLKLQHLPITTYTSILNSSKRNISAVKFCGEFGDPMMHPDIEEFIYQTITYNKDIEIHINTNGGLRTPRFYRELAANFPRSSIYIDFGIDGTTSDVNWKYREGVDFDRAMKNMRTWFRWNGSGSWHFIIFDWNWHQIPDAVSMAKDFDCRIKFKFNTREFGLITQENKRKAVELLEKHDAL